MAHFYATVRGGRGEAHRIGDKSNGATVTINSWDDGVIVRATHDKTTGQNAYTVIATGGSNGTRADRELFTVLADGTIKQ